jgi:hypothetical protein
VRKTLLQRSDRKPTAAEEAMNEWDEWNPAAGLLHSASKDPDVEEGEIEAERFLRRRLETRKLPDAVKSSVGTVGIDLPRVRSNAAFPRVLLARRTWRMFGDETVDIARRDPSTLRSAFKMDGPGALGRR